MHSFLGVIAFLISVSSPALALETRYYYGDVKFFSIEGKLSGETVSLVKRVLDPEHNKIMETVLQPGEKPGQAAQEYVVEMVRETDNVFKTNGSPAGYLKFFGKEWEWTSWDYSIPLEGGASLLGSGFLSGKYLLTSKTLSRAKPYMKVIERLNEIPPFEYERLREVLLQPHGDRP